MKMKLGQQEAINEPIRIHPIRGQAGRKNEVKGRWDNEILKLAPVLMKHF